MGKINKYRSNLPNGKEAIPREMRRRQRNPKSQTPGNQKTKHCQLLSIGGLPRKAYIRARAYKLRGYGEFCAFADKANGYG